MRVLAALGVCLSLAGCGFARSGPRLISPHQQIVTEGAARIHQGDTVTIGMLFACLDKPGSVTITDIAPVGAVGLEVTGWGVRPNPFWKPAPPNPAKVGGQIGVERQPLSRLGFPSSHVVDAACGQQGEGFELAVQVLKTTDGEAGASGWVATYSTEGETRKLGFTLAVRLCNEESAAAKPCRALQV